MPAVPAVPWCLAGLALAFSAGCAIPPPETDPGGDIREAVGLESDVAFHPEPSVVDEPVAIGYLTQALAVQRAIVTSAELQAALARVHVAEEAADLAGQFPNPVVSLVLRQPSGNLGTEVVASLTADLFGILRRPERATTAGHRLESEAASALSTALDIVTDVQTRYAECQVLERLVPAVGQRLLVFDRLIDAARERAEGGATLQHELDALEAERTALSIDLARRRQDVRLARLALAHRIGEPSGAADWTLEPWTRPAAVSTDEAPWLAAALSSRPELAALEWELKARHEEEGLASDLPFDLSSVGVEAEKESEGEDSNGDEKEGWSIGPKVEAPLAIFVTPEERVDQARAHTAEAAHVLTAARRTVVEDVRSALVTLQSAQENLQRVETELIPMQERRQAEVEETYRAGQADLTAVLLAEEALGRAQVTRLELEREVSAAQFRLQRAVGGPGRFRDPPSPAPSPSSSA